MSPPSAQLVAGSGWGRYLELRQLLHELFLLFAVGERWQDVQKDFEQVQALSRHTGQCEDRGDAIEGRHGRDR